MKYYALLGLVLLYSHFLASGTTLALFTVTALIWTFIKLSANIATEPGLFGYRIFIQPD